MTYFSQSHNNIMINKHDACWFATGMILCALISTCFTHPYTMYATEIGMKIRIACTSMIYKKVPVSFSHQF